MERILVAEDEDILRNLMVTTLESAGYSVVAARDGMEAWSLLEQNEIDVLLLDLLMPHLNGYELLTKLRADERYRDLPCLVLSNSGQIDDLNRAYECGADAVLIKASFNPDQLVGKVQEVIEKRRSSKV